MVYTNSTGAINVAFNLTQSRATINQLPEIHKSLLSQFSLDSKITVISNSIKTINGQDFVWVEFFSQAVDTKIYNVMFITSLDNRLFIGNFNCTDEHIEQWKPAGEKMANSIKIEN